MYITPNKDYYEFWCVKETFQQDVFNASKTYVSIGGD